jgi:ATP-dependent Clp protease adaptor protein ClpS
MLQISVHPYYPEFGNRMTATPSSMNNSAHTMTFPPSTARPDAASVADQRMVHLPLYKVLLHNDDVNSMEHVVNALMQVFKFTRQVCGRIMIEAHQNGVALCTIEPIEQAEHHRDQLVSLSLIATIEPE